MNFSTSLIFFATLSFCSINSKSLKSLIHKNIFPQVKDNTLDLSNLNLSCLQGIDEYPQIEEVEILNLSDNKLRSLTPLSLLTNNKIKIIDLNSNLIKDLMPLINLEYLQEIYIEDNLIDIETLISIIPRLKYLKEIIVDGNPINDPLFKYFQQKYKYINFLELYEKQIDEPTDDIKISFLHNPSEDLVCAICLCNNDLYLTTCKHVYHKECLEKWLNFCKFLKKITFCPCCRFKLTTNYNCNLEIQ